MKYCTKDYLKKTQEYIETIRNTTDISSSNDERLSETKQECEMFIRDITKDDSTSIKTINKHREEGKQLLSDDVRRKMDQYLIIDDKGRRYANNKQIKSLYGVVSKRWNIEVENLTSELENMGVCVACDDNVFTSVDMKLKNNGDTIEGWISSIRTESGCGDRLSEMGPSSSYSDLKKLNEEIAALIKNKDTSSSFSDTARELSNLISQILEKEYWYHQYIQFISEKDGNAPSLNKDLSKAIDYYKDNLRNKDVSTEIRERFLADDHADSIFLLVDYCLEKDYVADFSGKGKDHPIKCPKCGENVQSKESLKCSCGTTLFRKCTKCKRIFLSQFDSCLCGTSAIGYDEYLESFNSNFRKGDFNKASNILDILGKKYPDRVDELSERLKEARIIIHGKMADVKSFYEKGRFYSVKRIADEIMSYCSEYEPLNNYLLPCETNINEAEEHIKRAGQCTGDDEVNHYLEAFKLCSDHPDIEKFAKKNPPGKPKGITIEKMDRGAKIRIVAPESSIGLKYSLIKKEGSPATSSNEGTLLLNDTDTVTYDDSGLCPGVEYYYSAFCTRMGVCSPMFIKDEPFCILNPISNLRVDQRADGIQITFDLPSGAAGARIIRKKGSRPIGLDDGELVFEGGKGTVWDNTYNDLKAMNPRPIFFYSISAYYNTGFGIRYSELVHESFKIADIPAPILDLRIESEDDRHLARWSGQDCQLYDSKTELRLDNNTLNAEEFRALKISELPFTYQAANEKMFVINDDDIHYVYPVIRSGNYYVIGNCERASNSPPAHISVAPMGAICQVTLDDHQWPSPRCTEVGVTALAEGTVITRGTIKRDRYEREMQLLLSIGNVSEYTVKAIAYYGDFPSREEVREVRVVNRIPLYCSVTLGRLRCKLTIESNGQLSLHQFILRGSRGAEPNESSDVFYESPDEVVINKKFSDTIRREEHMEYIHWGLFFEDPRDSLKYRPIFK